MNAKGNDFGNAVTMAGLVCSIGVWSYAVPIACVAGESVLSLGWGITAIVRTTPAFLVYAWWMSHLLVDNGVTCAGTMAAFFLILGITFWGMAFGIKSVGNMTTAVISVVLAYLMKTTTEAIRTQLKFTKWSKAVFILVGLIFAAFYWAHFITYGS